MGRKSVIGGSGVASAERWRCGISIPGLPTRPGPSRAEISVRGAAVHSVRATKLRARDVHDHNTFDQPHVVAPETDGREAGGTSLAYEFPAASVTRLELDLGA